MPKGRKVSPVDRVRWLEEHDHGSTIIEIAKRDNRSQRTVTGQIARARREREQKEVRTGLLRDTYNKHYRELNAMAEQLSDRAARIGNGTLSLNVEGRPGLLLEGLRDHLPRSPLWKACRDWEYHAKQYLRGLEELRYEIGGAVGEDPTMLRESFIASLEFAAEQTAQGSTIDHMKYERTTNPMGHGLNWCSFPLADSAMDSGEIDRLEKKHGALKDQLLGNDMVRHLADTYGKWVEARQAIRKEVDVLVLRGMIPGQCKLCPQ